MEPSYTLTKIKEEYEKAKQEFLKTPSAENATEICNLSGRWLDVLYVIKQIDGAVFPEYIQDYFSELNKCLPLMEKSYKEAKRVLQSKREIAKITNEEKESLKNLEKIVRSLSSSLLLIRLRKGLIVKHQMGIEDY